MKTIFDQNPWWKDKGLIEADYDILKWKEKKYRWVPEVVDKIGLQPFALHIITGPRQTGKTTAIKLLIQKLLTSKDPRSLFYFNCENLEDYRELSEVLESYLEFRESNNIASSVILLDEVTLPREWYRAIKLLIDQGKFRNDVLIITGSASIAVKRQVELFPGRRGNGKDFVLYPLSFRGFLKVVDPELTRGIPPLACIDKIETAAVNALLYEKELQRHLQTYMEYGGGLLSIANLYGSKEEAYGTYLSWLKNAILKADRSDIIARQIAKAFVESSQSAFSWENVSKRIDIRSPKTVAAYADLLRSIFAITILYNIDLNEKTIRFGKNKKVHVRDPLLLEIFENWSMTASKNRQSALAEALVVEHLERAYPDRVFFWKNGFEIDAVVAEGRNLYGFEVKWSEETEAKRLSQLKKLVIVTKNAYAKDPPKIPLAVFLALFDV